MVVSYLEKIRDKFIQEKIDLEIELSLAVNERRENTEIIKVLEINDDPNFEAFTPRQVNSFNKNKILELRERQKYLGKYIEDYTDRIKCKQDEIDEIVLVIQAAKEM